MLGREGSNRTYREIGVPDAHHGLTHHKGDAEKIADIAKINRYHMEQFAYFIGKLHSTPDGDGSLLDHSMVVYGSGLADGNRHTHHDLPVLMAGRGCGTLKPGRHIRFPKETPMTNLYLSLLDRLGVTRKRSATVTANSNTCRKSRNFRSAIAISPFRFSYPRCTKNVKHRHRPTTGDHLRHDSVPFQHGGPLNLDLPQPDQLRCHLRLLEPQSLASARALAISCSASNSTLASAFSASRACWTAATFASMPAGRQPKTESQ